MSASVTRPGSGAIATDLSAPPAPRLPAALATGLSRAHLAGLDGLRAIAAFLVVFYHAGVPYVRASTGVLAFFVLSGFLITWLIIGEEDETRTVSLKRFYIRRSFRIFPAFYAYFVVLLAVWLIRHTSINWPQAISTLFYVSNYYQAIWGDPSTGLSHAWSLAVEEQFYLIWPLAFLLLRDNRRRFIALSALIPALWIYRELLVLVFHVDQGYIYEAFDTRVDHLLTGCWLAVALRGQYLGRLWRAVCASPLYVLATVGLLLLSVAIGHFTTMRDYRDTVEFVVQPVLFAVLIAQLIAFPSHPCTRPFNWGWMRYLGKLSYSIYLYQQLVIWPILQFFRSTPLLGLLATVPAVVIAAAGSYYFIERPFLNLRKRFA
jgi:peptidoglycan/LPS O-acetylase OafA/YrhL